MSLDILNAVVATTAQKTSEARKKVIAKGKASAWRKTWQDALRAHYPENVLDYTDRVSNNLKQAVRNRGLSYDDMPNFLSWIVANWTLLRQQVFSFNPKSPKGPPTPDLGIVVIYLVQVHALYMQTKPEIQAVLPIAQRLGRLPVKPLPAVPKPAPANASPPRATALRTVPLRSHTVDTARAEATRQKLNLPKWDA